MIYSKYAGAVCLAVFLPLILTAQRAPETAVPLKNWATPLYWQPSQAEREAAARASSQNAAPQLQFSGNQVSPSAGALTFVAITPCRLVDTRGAAAGFNGGSPFSGPSVAAAATVTFHVQAASDSGNTEPAPCGIIPSIAQAYSLNVTVIPHAAGVVDYITIWPSGAAQPAVSTLNDLQGQIVANAAIVPAGTVFGGVSVYNSGPATTDVIIDMNGFFAAPTDLGDNTAVGVDTLTSDTLGEFNTAIGAGALAGNTTGNGNMASGIEALYANTTGGQNTAVGFNSMQQNTTGSGNTANGDAALGSNNGSYNTAIGEGALDANTTGSYNIAIGSGAAQIAPPGNSSSIYIGSGGTGTDPSGVTYIGSEGTQTGGTYIAGISGASVSSGVEVLINSSGQLGTMLSSGRFKEQIADMGDSSSKPLQLRPVTFFYKPRYDDGSHELQYGLIAEEVAKVYPEMVAYGKDGQILTVKYQLLAPMLLNELQKQAEQIRRQAEQNRKLEDRLTALEALLGKVPATATASATTPAEAKIGLQNLVQ